MAKPQLGKILTQRNQTAPSSSVDFLILGAAKSGTTSLAQDLSSRDDVFIPKIKEVEFFSSDRAFACGPDHYERHFRPAPHGALVGEASPQYLYRDVAAQRISNFFSARPPRMIAILRNPIARAHSAYWQARALGVEKRTFEEAIVHEANQVNRQPSDPSGRTLGAYVGAGLYSLQLSRYFNLFPADNLLILFTEEYKQDPWLIRNQVGALLGLPDHGWATDPVNANAAKLPRSELANRAVRGRYPGKQFLGSLLPRMAKYRIRKAVDRRNMRPIETPPLSRDQFDRLHSIFLPDVERLKLLIATDLGPWGGLNLTAGLRVQ